MSAKKRLANMSLAELVEVHEVLQKLINLANEDRQKTGDGPGWVYALDKLHEDMDKVDEAIRSKSQNQ